MSVRLLELIVPEGHDAELDTILADADVVDRWHLGLAIALGLMIGLG